MQISVRPGTLTDQDIDALIILVGADRALGTAEAEIDARLSGALRQVLEDARFNGAVGKTLVLPTLGQLPAKRLVAIGIGADDRRSAHDVSGIWGSAARAARDAGARTIANPPPSAPDLRTASAY